MSVHERERECVCFFFGGLSVCGSERKHCLVGVVSMVL
jgi:hypothetical protein